MSEPDMSLPDAKATIEATAHAPRVTEDSIKAKIREVEYIYSSCHHNLTICVIHMQNNFCVLGKSAPVSAANFNAEVGKRYAYEDAFKQIWALEGYLLASVR